MRPLVALILLMLTVLACNLSQDESGSSTRITSTLIGITPSPTSATNTPNPTATATSSSSSNNNNSSSGNNNSVNRYVVNLPAPYPVCSVTPNGNFTVNIRSQANTSGSVRGILNPASWVMVKSLNNGWYQVSYPNTPVDNLWIAAEVVTLTQPCVCGPNCVQQAVPTATNVGAMCMATNTSGQTQPIFAEPGLITGDFVARFQAGATMQTAAFNEAGWIKVIYDAPNYTGWLLATGITIGAGCDSIPTEALPAPIKACVLINNTSQINTIFDQPDGEYVGRFWPDTPRYAVAKRSAGWYKIYEPAFSNFFWVEAAFVNARGACDSLPEE